jgi:cytochrome c-type biogenesis protein CcmH
MVLWVIFAVLTAIAAVAILRPFWRARPTPAAATSRDLEVYKQQLQEIEEEAARGLLGKTEADAARIEVSRRILTAAESPSPAPPAGARSSFAPYIMIALLPAIALSLYALYGSPNLPGQPLAARLPAERNSIEHMVARVEERLERHPEDGMGWSVIAPVYVRLGRYADAADAYRNAIRLLGETADRAADLGEAVALMNEGKVEGEARQAFDRALSIDANHAKSRFWLAIAEEQAGRPGEAIAIYRKLLERDLPDNVRSLVRDRIAMLEGGSRSPDAPQAGAAIDTAQINQMVSGLAERLKQDGSDLNGWLMLVRAYTVLGRKDDALGALEKARDKFAGNNEALGQIEALAKSLGLPS